VGIIDTSISGVSGPLTLMDTRMGVEVGAGKLSQLERWKTTPIANRDVHPEEPVKPRTTIWSNQARVAPSESRDLAFRCF